MTTQIQQNRYDQLLRRVAGIVGPYSKVSEVLSELFPMIDVENVPAELLVLMGTRTAMGGTNLGATAAEAGKYQIFNPADSNLLITITRILFSANSTGTIRWGPSLGSFDDPVTNQRYTDSRNPETNLPVGQLHRLSVAALANARSQLRVLANVVLDLRNEDALAILAPGTGFEIGFGTVNVGTSCSFSWRERVAEQSELNL